MFGIFVQNVISISVHLLIMNVDKINFKLMKKKSHIKTLAHYNAIMDGIHIIDICTNFFRITMDISIYIIAYNFHFACLVRP